MFTRPVGPKHFGAALALMVAAIASTTSAEGQDRLKGMPGYARFQEKNREIPGALKSGSLTVTWRDGGKAFEYRKDGKTYRYDVAAGKAEEAKPGGPEPTPAGRRPIRGGGAGRGQQFASLPSPDSTLKAFYRDRNLYISDPNGLIEAAVTSDGNEKDRTKNGKASWVYGEELNQNTAFWWSPDGKKLAYYRFDESKVNDGYHYLEGFPDQWPRSRTGSTQSPIPRPAARTPSSNSSFMI